MSMTLEQAKEKLAKYGQEHVLKYYGELTEEEKNQVSHRGKALQLMKEELKKYENIDRK